MDGKLAAPEASIGSFHLSFLNCCVYHIGDAVRLKKECRCL
jgi:hypothetical protein